MDKYIERNKRYIGKDKIRWKNYQSKYYIDNKDRIKDVHKKWVEKNFEYFNRLRKEYKDSERGKEKRRKWMREFRKENKDIIKVYNKSSKIEIPQNKLCEICNINLAKEKHHENYSKPLEIKFLCIKCHKKTHKNGR